MKYGARVYPLNSGKMLVKQTHKAEESGNYVLSTDSDKGIRSVMSPMTTTLKLPTPFAPLCAAS